MDLNQVLKGARKAAQVISVVLADEEVTSQEVPVLVKSTEDLKAANEALQTVNRKLVAENEQLKQRIQKANKRIAELSQI